MVQSDGEERSSDLEDDEWVPEIPAAKNTGRTASSALVAETPSPPPESKRRRTVADDPTSAFGPCPLCGETFSRRQLNKHANACLGAGSTSRPAEQRRRIPKGMWTKNKDVVASLQKHDIPALAVKHRERNERRFEEFRLKWNASIGEPHLPTRADIVRQVMADERTRRADRTHEYGLVTEGQGWTDESRDQYEVQNAARFSEMIANMHRS